MPSLSLSSTKSTSKTLTLIRKPYTFSRSSSSLHAFSTQQSDPSPAPNPNPNPHSRPLRGDPEDLARKVTTIMGRRPWTTSQQNAIRKEVATFTRPVILSVLTNSSTPDHSLNFFRWVEKTGFRHDQETYQQMIDILTRNSMLNHARCLILEDMPKRQIPPNENMFAALIFGYGKAGIPQEAVKMFQKMPDLGVERTVLTYDAFFKAILRSGRVSMAKRVYNRMIGEGVAPVLSTYNTLIWGFCLKSKMETAKRLFEDMKTRGVEPDVVTYNTLLNGWLRGGKLDEAEKVFEEIGNVGLVPNVVSYNLMIKGFMGNGRVDDGLRLFGEMRSKEMRTTERTYAAMMPWLCDDTSRTGDAKKVFDEMAERRITPKNKDKSVFLRLITSMCESDDLDEAVEVHKAMGQFRVRVNSCYYGVLIEGLCRGEKFDKAVEILDELLEKEVLLPLDSEPLEPSAYNPIIEYLCANGFTAKAETLFRQLMKRGVDDKIAFNHLIRGHAKEGKTDSAFEILSIMTRRGVESDSDAYVLLVESFLNKGEPADARTVLDGMIEQGHLPSAALFRSVMVCLFDDGRVQTASRVMKTMLEKGVKENMDMVQRILEALLMRGHVEEALGRINLMMEIDLAPDFDSLVVNLCDNKKPIPALKLVDFGLERDCDVAFSSYDRLLEALYNAGKTLPAYSILCKIKAKGGVVDKKGCDAVIKSLIDQGNTQQADILSRILAGKAPVGTKKGKKVAVGAY